MIVKGIRLHLESQERKKSFNFSMLITMLRSKRIDDEDYLVVILGSTISSYFNI